MFINTAMRNAFENMPVTRHQRNTHGEVIMAAATAIQRHSGEKKIPDWNAHLKFKTHQKLQQQGVMA